MIPGTNTLDMQDGRVLGTTFFVGPARHWRMMWHHKRAWATSAYLFCLLCTIVAVIRAAPLSVILLCIVCQFIAMEWYSLSYIPFERTIALNVLRGAFRV